MVNWISKKRIEKPCNEDNPLLKGRSEFDRDYGRVIHSSYFRRLQGKTQVWGEGEADFFRTRLTHSLEVAQIGLGLTKMFNEHLTKKQTPIPDALIQACCLAHDIGHPPLGHDGEEVLNDFCNRFKNDLDKDNELVCFDGNAQNLRILTKLDAPYPHYPDAGLNLTCTVLDGIIKYNTLADGNEKKAGYYQEEEKKYEKIVNCTKTGKRRHPLVLFVELADDITYSTHDLQDGMRSGFVTQRILHNWLDSFKTEKTSDQIQHITEMENFINNLTSKKLLDQDRYEYRDFQKVFFTKMIHSFFVEFEQLLKTMGL